MISISYIIEKIPLILEAVPLTLFLATTAMVIGYVAGFFVAIVRLYKIPFISQIASVYVSFARGTPLIVQMYLIFYGLPDLFKWANKSIDLNLFPTDISPIMIAIFIFSVYITAYQSEVWYAALDSVDYKQMEASLSVGMTVTQAFRRIIIPQALVNAIPNIGNLYINIVKGTSLVFVIQIVDIMAVAKIQAGDDYRYLEMYIAVSIVYWVINFTFERLFNKLERNFARYKGHITT